MASVIKQSTSFQGEAQQKPLTVLIVTIYTSALVIFLSISV